MQCALALPGARRGYGPVRTVVCALPEKRPHGAVLSCLCARAAQHIAQPSTCGAPPLSLPVPPLALPALSLCVSSSP